MGVVIKKLSTAKVSQERGGAIDFELNMDDNVGGIIHMQTNIWRIEMQKTEFVAFAVACIEGADRLKAIKNIE